MSVISCPKCQNATEKGGYHMWQILVAICFFPIGLLALFVDKKPTVCHGCGYTWNG